MFHVFRSFIGTVTDLSQYAMFVESAISKTMFHLVGLIRSTLNISGTYYQIKSFKLCLNSLVKAVLLSNKDKKFLDKHVFAFAHLVSTQTVQKLSNSA